MTPQDHMDEARRHIGLALAKHPGSVGLDALTVLLLQAVRLIDDARQRLSESKREAA